MNDQKRRDENKNRESEAPAEPCAPQEGDGSLETQSPGRIRAVTNPIALPVTFGSAGASPSRESRHPERSRPSSGVLFIEGKPTIIFDTVCTKGRAAWLAIDSIHQLLQEVWLAADAWVMGRYMIMPDHIHYFAGFTGSVIEYANWVKYWKSQFTKRHKDLEHRWQTDHWDTRMRTWQQYEEKWEYVRWNPVRSGLVEHPDQWPHQGAIQELRWEE